jgi:hypothetical protein
MSASVVSLKDKFSKVGVQNEYRTIAQMNNYQFKIMNYPGLKPGVSKRSWHNLGMAIAVDHVCTFLRSLRQETLSSRQNSRLPTSCLPIKTLPALGVLHV